MLEENETGSKRIEEQESVGTEREGVRKASEERFEAGGGGARPASVAAENGVAREKSQWWPSCFHKRWTKLDKTKFRDRIVWLKECRACGKKKVEVIFRDLNSRQVYTGRDVFAVEYTRAQRDEGGS